MNPQHSAFGMSMIAHDLSDAMDKLVDRASRPQRHSEGDCLNGTAATREPSLRSRPSGRVSDYRKDANND